MDEDLDIITQNTRKEQIKSFLIKYKNKFFFVAFLILLIIFSTFYYLDKIKKKKVKIANTFINASVNYDKKQKAYYLEQFIKIIDTNDPTYAPLSLFFLVDNKIISSKEEINNLFDTILNDVSLEREIKNLLIYKKALINADSKDENTMIEILKPLINTESVWKAHSLLLLGDYFLFKGEKQKAKDFYSKILTSEKTSKNIFNQTILRIRQNYDE